MKVTEREAEAVKEEYSAAPPIGSGLYEYAFIPVPKTVRKKSVNLFFVLAGYTATLSCLVLGAKIGAAMPFWQAVAACLIGDVALTVIGTGMGILAAKTGWSTAFLAQRILGKYAAGVFALLLLICTVLWVGVNGSLFSTMLIAVFPDLWLPVSVTALLVIALWAVSAAGGWKGVDTASKIVVPALFVLLLYTMLRIPGRMQGIDFLSAPPTGASMTFSVATAAVIGNFICGCIGAPDTFRYARSPKVVPIVCPLAYGCGMFVFHVCGIVVAKAGGYADFNRAAAALGILQPMLFCAILSLSTTQNMNIYISSLALQNLFQGTKLEGNVSHKTVVGLIAGIAAALSVSGISEQLVCVVSYISVVMAPLPGMLFGEALFFRARKKNPVCHRYTVLTWIAGICAGAFFLWLNFPVPTVLAMLFSGVGYVVVNRQYREKVA